MDKVNELVNIRMGKTCIDVYGIPHSACKLTLKFI